MSVFGRSGLPTMTNAYESATAPGIYFAGTITQGVAGLKKYGIPANSGAVHGHRYNIRCIVDHVAARYFGMQRPRPEVDPRQRRRPPADGSPRRAPELWHQKSYLARAMSRDAGRCHPRRGHRLAGRVRGRGRARTAPPSPSRPTTGATSIRRSTCADAAGSMPMPSSRATRCTNIAAPTTMPGCRARSAACSRPRGRARWYRARWTSASLARRVTATASTSTSSRPTAMPSSSSSSAAQALAARFVDDAAARERAAVGDRRHRPPPRARRIGPWPWSGVPTRPAAGRWHEACERCDVRLGDVVASTTAWSPSRRPSRRCRSTATSSSGRVAGSGRRAALPP